MTVARILLFALIATLLINRLLNTVKQEKEKRVYRKEFRYYIIIALAGIAMAVSAVYMVNPSLLAFAQFHTPDFVYWAGNALMLVGIILWILSKRALGSNWSPRIAIREHHTLVTSGPYRLVRHPIYTAYIIQVIGMCLAIANLAVMLPCAAIASLTWHRATAEEEILRQQFGEEYEQYSQKTGKFFPKLFSRS